MPQTVFMIVAVVVVAAVVVVVVGGSMNGKTDRSSRNNSNSLGVVVDYVADRRASMLQIMLPT